MKKRSKWKRDSKMLDLNLTILFIMFNVNVLKVASEKADVFKLKKARPNYMLFIRNSLKT